MFLGSFSMSCLQGCSQWFDTCCYGPQVDAMVFLGGFNFISVGCKFAASWLIRKLSWLLGSCCVVATGTQVIAMMFLAGFSMILVGCKFVASWLLSKLAGC